MSSYFFEHRKSTYNFFFDYCIIIFYYLQKASVSTRTRIITTLSSVQAIY